MTAVPMNRRKEPAEYPAIEPYETGMLDVGDGQRIYWETSGNPDGKPAVWLHGGPGSGSHPGARRLFDPAVYRIVQLDQRGSGRSTPYAGDHDTGLATNTTPHLLRDLELLREHLGIERWLVTGGSWGATLAFLYAEQQPDRVTGLVLVAVTNTSRRELDWMYRGGVAPLLPDEWERFRLGVPEAERDGDLLAAYHRLLNDPDPEVRRRAADEWCRWELSYIADEPEEEPFIGRFADPRYRLCFARVVTHYFVHDAWLEPNQILRDADRLAGIPGVMIHGRRDLGSPLLTAWLMKRAWPRAQLVVVSGAGHSSDPMSVEFVRATDQLAG